MTSQEYKKAAGLQNEMLGIKTILDFVGGFGDEVVEALLKDNSKGNTKSLSVRIELDKELSARVKELIKDHYTKKKIKLEEQL